MEQWSCHVAVPLRVYCRHLLHPSARGLVQHRLQLRRMGTAAVASLRTQDVKPYHLWRDFISQRQPAVLHGLEEPWTTFTGDTLLQHAGDAAVEVEVRASAADSYGQGRKQTMLFKEFMQQLRGGATNLYLSTQEVPVAPDGHPHLWAPPISCVARLLPLQPPLMGHLVPQAINVWMGAAQEGSSSGLHHDFHDNLYVLLAGRKRFRLWPPSAAPGMYTHGRLQQVYPNGRMVYEGQGAVLADGSDAQDVKAWRIKQAARLAVEAAEAAQRSSQDADPAAAAALAAADARLEAAFEQLLEMDAGSDSEGGHLQDDYIDSDADGEGSSSQLTSSSESGSEEEGGAAAKRRQHSSKAHGSNHQQQVEPKEDAGPPPSFSHVDLSLPPAQLAARFPLFPGKHTALVVELVAGDMLYLPAGWFHEVTSFSDTGAGGCHMAVNYWFHPPDRLARNKAAFRQPYTSPFFPELWQQRLGWLQKEIEGTRQQQQQQQGAPPGSKKRGRAAGNKDGLQGVSSKKAAIASEPAGGTAAAAGGREQPGSSGRPGAGLQVQVPAGKARRVSWPEEVHSPTNRYRQSMTHTGTASGSPEVAPRRRSQEERLAEEMARDQAAAAAAAAAAGGASEDGDSEGSQVLQLNKAAVQQLLAQFLASQQGRRRGRVLTRRVPVLPGRRHHTVVILKEVPRPRAPR